MTGSFTMQPTFDQETYIRARDAWDAGGFGPEWGDWRGMAGKRGIIFPPDGTIHDSWGDARPSQRAILIRAIRETPRLLRWAIAQPGVRSWGDVIGNLLTARDQFAIDAERRARDWSEIKRGRAPTPLRDIAGVLGDSLGLEERP